MHRAKKNEHQKQVPAKERGESYQNIDKKREDFWKL